MNLILKARIIEKFGTQADFAVVAKGDESLVSRIVRGRRFLSAEDQKVWAALLDCKPNQLFEQGVQQ